MAVTLKEVADHAGVSISTVSRFVAGKPIRKRLEEPVRAALTALEYRPNLSARRLKSGTSRTFGLVVPDIRNPFFQRLISHIEDLLWARQCGLIVCNSDETPDRQDHHLATLESEGIAGVLIAPASPDQKTLLALAERIPVVVLDRTRPSGPFHSVTIDNVAASARLVEVLFEAGHRRIVGLFTRPPVIGAERRRGFAETASALGMTPLTLPVGHKPAARRAAVAKALDLWPDLDAVVAGSGPVMFAAAVALRQRRHPATLAGFDYADWLPLIDRPAFWVDQPIEDMARTAVDMLLDRAKATPEHRLFQGKVASSRTDNVCS